MADARMLRAFYRDLEARYGPLIEVVMREHARLTTEAWWTARQASGSALVEAAKREHGRGRRPSLAAVDRRFKRQGLGLETFDQLLRRLEELTKSNRRRPPSNGTELLEQLDGDGKGGGLPRRSTGDRTRPRNSPSLQTGATLSGLT